MAGRKTPPSDTRLRELYAELGTSSKVGVSLGVSQATAYRWLVAAGAMVKKKRVPGLPARVVAPSESRLRELYAELRSARKVGVELGVSQSKAYLWLVAAGCELVGRGPGLRDSMPEAGTMTDAQVGELHGVTRAAVHAYRKRRGIPKFDASGD